MRCLPSSVNQRGHAVSPSGSDPGRFTLWPGHPNPVEPVGREGRHGARIAPSTVRPRPLDGRAEPPIGIGTFRMGT